MVIDETPTVPNGVLPAVVEAALLRPGVMTTPVAQALFFDTQWPAVSTASGEMRAPEQENPLPPRLKLIWTAADQGYVLVGLMRMRSSGVKR